MGGIPDARIVYESIINIGAIVVFVDGVAEHLKWSTGQLNYFKSFARIVLVYGEVFYPLACRLQVNQ